MNVLTLTGSFGRRTDPCASPQADQRDLVGENHKALLTKYVFLLVVHPDKQFPSRFLGI